MSNTGNFNNGPPTALMSYPFPMHNPPQHPSLMEQPYMNPISQHFQPYPPPNYNLRPTMQTPKSEKRKQEILTCDVCGIEVNSQQMMDAHLQGQKHIKKMKLKVVSTATPPTTQPLESTDINQDPPLPEVASSNATIEVTVPSIEQNPVPSATVAKATSSNERSVLQSINEMAKFNKVNAKYDLIKETGPAHCKQFEVRLSLGEETYAGTGTSIKRAQQDAAEKALTATVLKRPESTPRGSHSTRAVRGSAAGGGGGGGTNRGMYSNVRPSYPIQTNRQKSYSSIVGQQNENLFQNLINNKCSEITENENTIRILHQLVEDIERALKTVSDKIMEQSKQNNISVVPQLPDNVKLNNIEQPNDDPTESFRMLKGAMKVSKLAMRLFYKYDYEYSLVLICANKPTITLLNDICQELSIGLNAQAIAALQLESNNEQSTPITYQIEKYINDACLTVQCSRLPKHIIRIMLTSPVFRSENFLNLDEQTREQISELNPDPSDMLDKNKCLEAAAEIRHSNWFTRCMSENPSNLSILHLLRDLQYHQTPLSSLNLWCIILLVYQCQNRSINSSLNLFRSVFSCLSSGILLPNYIGPGIIDPCEKELVDASAYLTTKQRLDITKYAHDTLRLIAFEKYEDIFQFETNPNPNPNSNEQLLINSTTATYLME